MIELALGLSLHLGLNNNYNEIHPHVRWSEQGFIAGAYYNSESNISAYGGYRLEYGDVGLEAGAVTGYSKADVMPFGRITYKDCVVSFNRWCYKKVLVGYTT